MTLSRQIPRERYAKLVASRLRRRDALPLLALLSVFAGACTLRALPKSTEQDCRSPSTSTFWTCLSRIPRPDRSETAFVSTLRAGSPIRKMSDQLLESSCTGPFPEDVYSELHEKMPAGRAPLHALFAGPQQESGPIVILVHGIFDSKFTKYIQVTADLLRDQGFGVLLPDMRWHGCLLDKEWLPTLGIEEGRDLVAWARFLKADYRKGKYRDSAVGLVGFSLGGLSVLHSLGSAEGPNAFQAGGVVFCPASGLPYTMSGLDAPAFVADRGLAGLFRSAFRHYLRQRLKTLSVPPDNRRLFAAFLDWLARQPPFGPDGTAEDLLSKADPAPIAAKTRRPTLILTTSNDPIISIVGSYDLERAAEGNPYLHVVRTQFGGHIGQIGLWPRWFADTLTTFFRYSSDIP